MFTMSPFYWLAFVALVLVVFGAFMPAYCPENDDCELVESAFFSFERFSEEDVSFGEGIAANIFGNTVLIMAAIMAGVLLLRLHPRILQVIAAVSLLLLINYYFFFHQAIFKNEFFEMNPGWGWGPMFLGVIGVVICAFLIPEAEDSSQLPYRQSVSDLGEFMPK